MSSQSKTSNATRRPLLPVWKEIDYLVFEARTALTMDGFDRNPGTEAFYDPATIDETTENIVGAKVFAYDEQGNRGEEIVWYPDRWYEREQEERRRREQGD